ncbi:hypothetical protein POVWA2_022850 [Plasmodium ovale wallikeri]|nr:hypothetical protein POVWA2_022850 [Plasmodium ovale wallikeri]
MQANSEVSIALSLLVLTRSGLTDFLKWKKKKKKKKEEARGGEGPFKCIRLKHLAQCCDKEKIVRIVTFRCRISLPHFAATSRCSFALPFITASPLCGFEKKKKKKKK